MQEQLDHLKPASPRDWAITLTVIATIVLGAIFGPGLFQDHGGPSEPVAVAAEDDLEYAPENDLDARWEDAYACSDAFMEVFAQSYREGSLSPGMYFVIENFGQQSWQYDAYMQYGGEFYREVFDSGMQGAFDEFVPIFDQLCYDNLGDGINVH